MVVVRAAALELAAAAAPRWPRWRSRWCSAPPWPSSPRTSDLGAHREVVHVEPALGALASSWRSGPGAALGAAAALADLGDEAGQLVVRPELGGERTVVTASRWRNRFAPRRRPGLGLRHDEDDGGGGDPCRDIV